MNINYNYKSDYYYDDKLISLQADSYSYKSRIGSFDDLQFRNFYGTETVYNIYDNNNLEFVIDYHKNRGKFKVVFIDENNNIDELIPGKYNSNELPSSGRIKIVGDNASGYFQFKILE